MSTLLDNVPGLAGGRNVGSRKAGGDLMVIVTGKSKESLHHLMRALKANALLESSTEFKVTPGILIIGCCFLRT